MKKPSVFKFTDPAKFLRAFYKMNSERGKFSYRTMAKKFDTNISLVHGYFSGRLNITVKFFKNISKLIKLNRNEKAYFEIIMYLARVDMPQRVKNELLLNLKGE